MRPPFFVCRALDYHTAELAHVSALRAQPHPTPPCPLHPLPSADYHTAQNTRIRLKWSTGAEAHDWEAVAKKDNLNIIQVWWVVGASRLVGAGSAAAPVHRQNR